LLPTSTLRLVLWYFAHIDYYSKLWTAAQEEREDFRFPLCFLSLA